MVEIFEKIATDFKALKSDVVQKKQIVDEVTAILDSVMCKNVPETIESTNEILKDLVKYYNTEIEDSADFSEFCTRLTHLESRLNALVTQGKGSKHEILIMKYLTEDDDDLQFDKEENALLAKAYKDGKDRKVSQCEDDNDEESDEYYYDEDDEDWDDDDDWVLRGESFVIYVYDERVYVIVDGDSDFPMYTFSNKFQKKLAEVVKDRFTKKEE